MYHIKTQKKNQGSILFQMYHQQQNKVPTKVFTNHVSLLHIMHTCVVTLTFSTVAAEQLSHTLMRMQDGLYYFYLLVEDSAPYQDAKEYCEQLPGFHLPIVITQKQFDTVTSFPEPGPGNGKKKY